MKQNPKNNAARFVQIVLSQDGKLSQEWSTEYKMFMSLHILLRLSHFN